MQIGLQSEVAKHHFEGGQSLEIDSHIYSHFAILIMSQP